MQFPRNWDSQQAKHITSLTLPQMKRLGFTAPILDAAIRGSAYTLLFGKSDLYELDLSKLNLCYTRMKEEEGDRIYGANITYGDNLTVDYILPLAIIKSEDDALRQWFTDTMTNLFSLDDKLNSMRAEIIEAYKAMGDHITARSGGERCYHRHACVAVGNHNLPILHQPVFRVDSDDTGEEIDIKGKAFRETFAQWLPGDPAVQKAFHVYLAKVKDRLQDLLESPIVVKYFHKHTPASRDTHVTMSTPKGVGYTIKISQYDHLRKKDFHPDAFLTSLCGALL
jgi:hypothetical protein